MNAVRDVLASDTDALAAVLGRAFADDPAAQQRGGPSVIEGEYQRREEDRDRLR